MADSPDRETTTRRKVTVRTLQVRRDRGEAITMVTAYDCPMARLAQRAGIDAILVGDSLAMVVLGHEDTLAVTMDEMLHHARAVRRGADLPLLVGDMPFMSYQADVAEAVRNAGRFLKEAGMDAVKLEGGARVVKQIRAICDADIPVMGHLGLTPQSVRALGGWKAQGMDPESAEALLRDARRLEEAGCFAVVLEAVPARLAERITRELSIPVIGIGAGARVNGQVLVMHDLLGLFDNFKPRFVRRYADLAGTTIEALRTYRAEVKSGRFPSDENSYHLSDAQWGAVCDHLEKKAGAVPAGGQRPRSISGGRR